jgi:hypothetical protein
MMICLFDFLLSGYQVWLQEIVIAIAKLKQVGRTDICAQGIVIPKRFKCIASALNTRVTQMQPEQP